MKSPRAADKRKRSKRAGSKGRSPLAGRSRSTSGVPSPAQQGTTSPGSGPGTPPSGPGTRPSGRGRPPSGPGTPPSGPGTPQPVARTAQRSAHGSKSPIRSRDSDVGSPTPFGPNDYFKGRGQQSKRQFGTRVTMGTTITFVVIPALLLVATIAFAIYYRHRMSFPARQTRFVSSTVMGHYSGWVAVSGAKLCANISRKIFARNGTVGDAAVATMLCNCVALPHYCGLGGGFVATYYNRMKTNATAVMVRTRAPSAASQEMYRGNPNASLVGAMAVGVFGELKGYELLLNVTGSRVPWRDLFEDAIKLADNGIVIDPIMGSKISATLADADDELRKHLSNQKTTRPLETGDIYTNKELAATLLKIANSEKRGRYFDSGEDIEAIVHELNNGGGLHTTKDFEEFEAVETSPVSFELQTGERLFSTPPPASGAVLGFVVKVMDAFRTNGELEDTEENMHRLVEAIKFGFGRRTDIGDPDAPEARESVQKALDQLVSPEGAARVARDKIKDKPMDTACYAPDSNDRDDHGTGIISIVAPDGDAISMASTINTEFGAHFRSTKTGLWLNNEMNDFSSPFGFDVWKLVSSSNNYIRPGRRARSSLCPAILVDSSGDVVFAASATGGPASISALAEMLIRSEWMNHTIKEAIDAGRLHNQLYPEDVVMYENTTDADVVAALRHRGHVLRQINWPYYSVGIHRSSNGTYTACHDFRNLATGSSDGGELK